ncbi:hypothetical protein K7T73_18660 [Bacillus badius]|nr:hypothetical protein [Bacillus badius]UAT30529.1 hypothetical protein K7T73_18660 [Bacillus badius]
MISIPDASLSAGVCAPSIAISGIYKIGALSHQENGLALGVWGLRALPN